MGLFSGCSGDVGQPRGKPGYNQADVITSVKWNGSYVVTEYSNDPANFVYALNPMSDEVMMNFYIEVIAVSRKDVGMA